MQISDHLAHTLRRFERRGYHFDERESERGNYRFLTPAGPVSFETQREMELWLREVTPDWLDVFPPT